MVGRLFCLSLAILAALPAAARVISYAPYSNLVSIPGYHERDSRRFVLIETVDDEGSWGHQQLVLYDSKGIDEPRVVYPPDGTRISIESAALYEPKGNPAASPILLVSPRSSYGIAVNHFFSGNGGATWTELIDLRNRTLMSDQDRDFGGPYVYGMSPRIRAGNDAWPFVIETYTQGIYRISAGGEARILDDRPVASLVGRNRAGTRVLIRGANGIDSVDLNDPAHNRIRIVSGSIAGNNVITGWLTDDGSAYIQVSAGMVRFLYFRSGAQTTFIAGPYDVVPPPLNSTFPSNPNNTDNFFAVPTHDFEGAWLLQRKAGRPTTLSRHTRASGVQQMWSDASGPEVEALIAGNSGDTLLVQVHRDRSSELEHTFVDPALAIWRVGDPMPRQYDELYLNEEWNKGFVHADVDAMASGEPFVFNSGAHIEGGDDFSSGVGGGGDVIQEWGVVRGSLKQHLILPGVARLHGAFASRWLTDVTLYNPLDTPQDVVVRFVPSGSEVQSAALYQQALTLAPRAVRFIPDALHALFAIGDGGGALHLIPALGINAVARTYSERAGGGTFGFGMQGIDLFNAAGPRFPMTFAGAFPGPGFRTNVLLTDTSGRGAQAFLGGFGSSGPMGASAKTIDAPPGGTQQFNSLDGTLGLFSTDAGGLMIQPTRGTAIATVVAIDNRTNDPTYFPPDVATSSLIRTIPIIGHVDGANGSRFRTDLYLVNPTNESSSVFLEAKQWDSSTIKVRSYDVPPRGARVIRDALPAIFGMTGLARLRYRSETNNHDGVRVTSRTYTVDANGATYGSLIPPLNNFQIATAGDSLEIFGINGGNAFRANLGLVELSGPRANGADTTVYISIRDANLHELDAFTVLVPWARGMQINDIFHARGIAMPEAAFLAVRVAEGTGGRIGAYVTLVDNNTNDATYLASQLGAQDN
jgi:hypothetical protein